jgi:hypothetical protein
MPYATAHEGFGTPGSYTANAKDNDPCLLQALHGIVAYKHGGAVVEEDV